MEGNTISAYDMVFTPSEEGDKGGLGQRKQLRLIVFRATLTYNKRKT